MTRTLFESVRSEQNVFAAWRHVRKSALTSGNGTIRGEAAELEHQHHKHIRRIIDQLREDRLVFDGVTGVLKDKKERLAQNKAPRPIAIATLKNRVVQRAILQVLQPRKINDPRDIRSKAATISDGRLGRINDVNRSSFGVGGLMRPYGGVAPAIKLVSEAMKQGAKYYYQSDIRAFFTKIPQGPVKEIVLRETGDRKFADLFARALKVHLSNPDELIGYHHLFPSNGLGVAQGSSLSAFAGNLLLYDLDHDLNQNGVTAVRYIDDILIVSDDKSALDEAIDRCELTLSALGFGLYSATDGSGKANYGPCDQSITFLGCTLQPNRCVPSTQSCASAKTRVRDSLSKSKAGISKLIAGKSGFRKEHALSTTLQEVSSFIYGWQKSFAFCTDAQPFSDLDRYVSGLVLDYKGFVGRMLAKSDLGQQMKVLGVPSMLEMHRATETKG